MVNFSKKANLKPIEPNKLKIEKSNEFPDAYAVYLELDSEPDDVWRKIFEDEYRKSLYTRKRPVMVLSNALRVVIAPNEIKEKIEWIKGLVESTNNRVDEYNKEVERKKKEEEQEKLRIEETIRKMRESLKEQ